MTRSVRSPLRAALGIAALAVTACTGGSSDAVVTTTTTSTTTTVVSAPVVPEPVLDSVDLDVTLPRRVPAESVTWTLEVTNPGDASVTLTFPTAQEIDATLWRGDALVHRWSDGRFFDQALHAIVVEAGETVELSIVDALFDVEPGTYTLELELLAVGPPEPLRRSVRIVAADA